MLIMRNFTAATKELKDVGITVLIFTDENGNDWYESQTNFSKTGLKFTFDDKGVIVSASWDVSMLVPENLSVGEVSKSNVPATFFDDGTRWKFNGKKIIPFEYSKDELREQAESQRAELLSAANEKIIPLQARLSIGRQLSDDQLKTLNSVLDYIDELEACDPMAEGFVWPELKI